MAGNGNILARIRSTCKAACDAHPDVATVDVEAIKTLAASLDPIAVTVTARGVQLPIRFDNQEAEITFLALYHLVDIGSGYDPVLRAKTGGRDSREISQYGALGLHLNVKSLDAAWMASFSDGRAQSTFGIETHEDVPIENLPGVTMSRPGVLSGLVRNLSKVVTEAGEALQQEGATSFGQAILAVVNGLQKHPTPAAALVQELVENIPGFRDAGLVDGQQVVYARKAQALVFSLYTKFSKSDPRFNFSDIANLAGDSGALLAGVFRLKGVIKLAPELEASIAAGQELAQGTQERVIRAATVLALDALAAAMDRKASPAQLSAYFLYLTEQGQELHGLTRPHLTQGTIAY